MQVLIAWLVIIIVHSALHMQIAVPAYQDIILLSILLVTIALLLVVQHATQQITTVCLVRQDII
jgi:hypothetical protein